MHRPATSGWQLPKPTLLSRNCLWNCPGPTYLFGHGMKAALTLPTSLQPTGIAFSLWRKLFQLFHKLNLNQRLRAQSPWETDEQKKAGIFNNPAAIKMTAFSFCKPSVSNPDKNPCGPAESLNHGITKHISKKKIFSSLRTTRSRFIQPNILQVVCAQCRSLVPKKSLIGSH